MFVFHSVGSFTFLLWIWNKMPPFSSLAPSLGGTTWLHHFFPRQVFKPRTSPEAITLCSRLLEYTPASRLSPLEACAHAFFDELRQLNARLPSGRELPLLFNFSTTGQSHVLPHRYPQFLHLKEESGVCFYVQSSRSSLSWTRSSSLLTLARIRLLLSTVGNPFCHLTIILSYHRNTHDSSEITTDLDFMWWANMRLK